MSNLADEPVLEMPPLSMRSIEGIGAAALEHFAAALREPTPLDVLNLAEVTLPKSGIHVYPVGAWELPDQEAVTDPRTSTGEVIIRVREEVYDDLVRGGARARRPRATVMHEVAHAILHSEILRRRMESPVAVSYLPRRSRDVPAYKSSEWQAWALATCMLMPRSTIRMLADRSPSAVSRAYEVSEELARRHIDRLSRAGQL